MLSFVVSVNSWMFGVQHVQEFIVAQPIVCILAIDLFCTIIRIVRIDDFLHLALPRFVFVILFFRI